MAPVLECAAVIDIIVVCDSLLYKVSHECFKIASRAMFSLLKGMSSLLFQIFNDVLVPSCIQDIPDR